MRLSSTLSLYIGRQIVGSFLLMFAIFLAMILLLDVIELLRRAATRDAVTFGLIIEMALLKLPHMGQKVFPFAALFGGMAAYWRLSRSHELEVTRAAGVSVWQFLLPALTFALGLGLFQIAVFNPLASTTLTRFELLEARYFKGQTSTLAISQNGLWLRQGGALGPSVIHALGVVQQGSDVDLNDVTVFRYSGTDRFVGQITAETAELKDGYWLLEKVWVLKPEEAPTFEDTRRLPTDLTLSRIQNNFAPPETMSFWDLPGFIETLDRAGFSATRHRLHWHSLLATPLLMCAMILLAATFTLRHARRGGTLMVITGGVVSGFLLYFLSDLVLALGASDAIPVVLAAWTPSGVAALLGVAMLLHLEDG
jgi:lipopolysaccharide export system permease protein